MAKTLLRSLASAIATDVREALAIALARRVPEPTPDALGTMRQLVLSRGIGPLQSVAASVDASVAAEYALALIRLSESLEADGYPREAEQVFFLLSGDWR